MHKAISIFLICLFTINNSIAQHFIDFGQPSKEEIQFTNSSFTDNSDVIVLKHEAYTEFSWSGKIYRYEHLRIKILNSSAINYANVTIPFFSKDVIETIEDIKGVTININVDNATSYANLDPNTIYKSKKNEYFSEISFSMPNIKTGSIIEYTFKKNNTRGQQPG